MFSVHRYDRWKTFHLFVFWWRVLRRTEKLRTTVRLGDVAVFENRQTEPLLSKVTEDENIFYRWDLFCRWNRS